MSQSDFFDSQHEGDLLPLPLHFRLLRRWEVKREDVALALLPGGDTLLDIGCGDGTFARRAAARYRSVIATDVSPAAVSVARERFANDPSLAQPAGSAIEFRVVDANDRLANTDDSVDGIVALSTLQYLLDPERFLAEARRVLRPGGHLLVEVPNLAYLPQRLRLLAGRPPRTSFWPHGIDGGNLHYFTADSLRGLVRDAGFVGERLTGSGIFAPLRTWWTPLLCGNLFLLARKP